MKKVLVLVYSTVGSSLGWWLGSKFGGIMTSFMISTVGMGVGIWAGARHAKEMGV